MKQLTQIFRRLAAGVPVHARHPADYAGRLVITSRENASGDTIFQAVIMENGRILQLYESARMHTLRKIVTGYYPAAARHFGPARLCVGW